MEAHTSVEEQEIVVQLYKSGKSQTEISKVVNKSSSTAQSYWKGA